MTNDEPLLRVEGLAVSYGAVRAVRGVSFVVPRGTIVTVIGANGAGKTSTLLGVSGVVPARGRILLDGRDLNSAPAHRRVAAGIAQVPEGRQVLARMSVEENLEMGAYTRHDRAAIREDITAMYRRFPLLQERRGFPAGSLSGGEQQMLALARALMARPRLLLLDEPSMGLAPLLVAQIFALVRDVRDSGTTVLLVEQNARQALAISDYAYVMENGTVTLEGKAADLARDEAVTAAYLGRPAIK